MKWNVASRIASGYFLSLLIFGIVGYMTDSNAQKMVEDNKWVDHTYEVLAEIETLVSELKDMETGQRGFLITGKDRYLEPYFSGLKGSHNSLEKLRSLTSDNANQQARIIKLESQIQEKVAELKETIALRQDRGFEAARKVVLSDRGKEVMDRMRETLKQMTTEERNLLVQRAIASKEAVNVMHKLIIYSFLGAFVILGLIGFWNTKTISLPLQELAKRARLISEGILPDNNNNNNNNRDDEVGELDRSFGKMTESLRTMSAAAVAISEGDLTVQIQPQSSDDVMGNALKGMVENLRKVIIEIRDGIKTLSGSTMSMGESVVQLSAIGNETSASVTETTTTVQEVRQTSEVASRRADAVSEGAREASKSAQNGKVATDAASTQMENIRTQMRAIGDSILRLSERSQAIGEIISSVDDISEQSNLLAVNASIEAAKAGEQGKGFGVVAQEIKNLADQSKNSTSQVRTILNDIQKATSAAVMATEEGGKAVEEGVSRSNQINIAIDKISETVDSSAEAAIEIAASSRQQMTGVEQVSSAMGSIKEGMSRNLDTITLLKEGAQNLEELGKSLDVIVKRNKL